MSNLTAKEMVTIACNALEDKKASDIKVINIEKVSSIADFFIIASGTSSPHTKALSDFVEEKVQKELNENILRREGYRDGTWVLLDYGDIVVHVFNAEARDFYSLERLWSDGVPVDLSGVLTQD